MSINSIKDIIIGEKSTFILKDNGEMFVSGHNTYWQLGLNDNQNRCLFTRSDIHNVDTVYSFSKHTILKTIEGNILATGLNHHLQFGTNSIMTNYRFEEVGLCDTKKLFATEESTYVIGYDDAVIASGNNDRGQLGLGGHLEIYGNKEFSISSITGLREIIVNNNTNYAFALSKGNILYATGGNDFGQLGCSDNSDRYSFVEVSNNVKKVIAQKDFSLLLTYDDEVYFAGNNKRLNIELNKSFTFEFKKLDTKHLGKIKDIYANENIIVLQTYEDTLYGIGYDLYNQINSSRVSVNDFTKISFSQKIDKLILTKRSMIILSNNNLYINGEFLFNKYSEFFELLQENVKDFYASYDKIFFIDLEDNLYGMGRNNHGDLGVGTYNPFIDKPILIDFL